MIINRDLAKNLQKYLGGEPKVLILYGPRQAGKTTLLNHLLIKTDRATIAEFTGDDLRTQELFGTPNLSKLKQAVGGRKLLVIDEAQRIPDIGLSLKLLFDSLKIRTITTGSSSFELANKVNEPLTGRAAIFLLYPIAIGELSPTLPDTSLAPRLEEFLRFGMYPKTLTITGEEEKQKYLNDLISNYLYKDILAFESVRKPKKIIDLLSLLALQIGQELSVAELSRHLALSVGVVEKYLDILEKMFIIINIRGFSRNLRKEIYKTSKYYFVDLGLRNALIRNFNPLNIRTDTGVLFENFMIMEKIKKANNSARPANFYFWRTYDQKEIDLIEEKGGLLSAFEIKWSKGQVKAPQKFLEAYKNSTFEVINKDNWLDFIAKS